MGENIERVFIETLSKYCTKHYLSNIWTNNFTKSMGGKYYTNVDIGTKK